MAKIDIGEKIKQIMKAKDIKKQSVVYPRNQSLVSQIINGKNKNPNEQTLRLFAENMDVPFEELIEGTTWVESSSKIHRKSEYAFSQTECVVTINDSGVIKTRMKSYPMINDSGEENKFDPDTGYKLLTECKSCKRTIQQSNQVHCFGCGEKLFNDYTWHERVFNKTYYYNNWNNSIIPDGENPDDYPDKVEMEYRQDNFTINTTGNAEVLNRLSYLLKDLIKIEQLTKNGKLHIKGNGKMWGAKHDLVQGDLRSIVLYYYENYFKDYYYFIATDGPDGEYLQPGIDSEDFEAFSPTGESFVKIPIKYKDKMADMDEFLGHFYIDSLIITNPNKINSIVRNWWGMFRYDLSMTKGLFNEMMRHRLRLREIEEQKEDENKIESTQSKTNEKKNETYH